jgi:hypothetical protein
LDLLDCLATDDIYPHKWDDEIDPVESAERRQLQVSALVEGMAIPVATAEALLDLWRPSTRRTSSIVLSPQARMAEAADELNAARNIPPRVTVEVRDTQPCVVVTEHGPAKPFRVSVPEAKRRAKDLRKLLAPEGLRQMAALELVAQLYGYKGWNRFLAVCSEENQPAALWDDLLDQNERQERRSFQTSIVAMQLGVSHESALTILDDWRPTAHPTDRRRLSSIATANAEADAPTFQPLPRPSVSNESPFIEPAPPTVIVKRKRVPRLPTPDC